MKKTLFVLLLVALSLMTVSAVLAQDGEMSCPGHEGTTIASLRECVTHAAAEGHITSQWIVKSLLVKLDAAQFALDHGHPRVAVLVLKSFVHQVQALSGKYIHAEHAAHMIEHAGRVIAALGG